MCGENESNNISDLFVEGSPPRVRGKHRRDSGDALRERITPACAGKTFRVCAVLAALGDHPRVCGENVEK